MGRHKADLEDRAIDRFFQRAPINLETGCAEWSGRRDSKGYGQFDLPRTGDGVRAHRHAWELTYGPIPDGLYVLHRCDNPPCVFPLHLFLGTNDDNMADREAKGRNNPQCGEKQGLARLTEKTAREAMDMFNAGYTLKEIGLEFSVDASTIGYVVNGVTWRHLGLVRTRPRHWRYAQKAQEV